MKKILFCLVLISMLLTACGSRLPAGEPVGDLLVTGPDSSETYSSAELEAIDSAEAEFEDVVYRGVPLQLVLVASGFEIAEVGKVTARATDGYQVTYSGEILQRPDVLVAYATVDGQLSADDGTFRMVLPGEPGNQNLRMLAELIVE